MTELMVVLAIAGILSAAAVPSWQLAIAAAKQRLHSAAIQDAVRMARDRARTEGTPITLCPLTNGLYCGNNWQAGWALLRLSSSKEESNTLKILEKNMGDEKTRISANRELFTFEPSGHATNGTLMICASGSTKALNVVISSTGKSRLATEGPAEPAPCE
jgi:type IV fimbrial biogenesis protein FimT